MKNSVSRIILLGMMFLLPLSRNLLPKEQSLWGKSSLTSKTATLQNSSPSSVGWIAFHQKNNIWLVHPDGSGLKQITFDGDSGTYKWVIYGPVTWSRDGTKLFAFKSETPDIVTQFSYSFFQLDVTDFLITITPLEFFNDEESLHIENGFSFSPDNKSIAFIHYVENSKVQSVMIMNLETGKSRTLFEIHDYGNEVSFIGDTIWSSDGKNVNFSSTSINIEPNSDPKPWMNHFINVDSLADTVIPGYCLLSPQGDQLACLEIDQGGPRTHIVTIIDTRIFAVQREILFVDEVYPEPIWANDNRHIIIKTSTDVVNGTTFYLVDSQTGEAKEIIEKTYNADVNLSPDANWLVGRFDFEGNLFLINTSDGKKYPLAKGDGAIWQPQITTTVNPTPIPVIQTGSNVLTENWIAYVGPDENIWLIHPDGSALTQLTFDGKPGRGIWDPVIGYRNLKWSPDGSLLGMTRIDENGSDIQAIRMSDISVMLLISDVEGSFDWLPDGRSIIYSNVPYEPLATRGNRSGGLSLFEISTGKITSFVDPGSEFRLTDPHWTPKGENVFFTIDPAPIPDGIYFSWLGLAKSPGGSFAEIYNQSDCSWSPEGDRLACATGGGEIYCNNIVIYSDVGEKLADFPPIPTDCPLSASSRISSPAWSPEGNLIVFTGEIQKGNGIYTIQNDGSGLIPIVQNTTNIFSHSLGAPLQWAPDGKTLVFRSGILGSMNLSIINVDGSGINKITQTSGDVRSFAWQPVSSIHPTPVTRLQAHPGLKSGEVVLQWNSPNPPEPGSSRAVSYEFRYSQNPITEEKWGEAQKIDQEVAINTNQVRLTKPFDLNTRWFFAVKTMDETGSRSSISNVPWLLDTGFRPSPDGFCFSNSDGKHICNPNDEWKNYSASQDYTFEDVQHMFGMNFACIIYNGNECKFKDPKAVIWWKILTSKITSRCFGMNASAQFFFNLDGYQEWNDKKEPSDLDPKAKKPFDLSLTSSRRYITYLFSFQDTNPIKAYMKQVQELTPKDIIDLLQTALENKPPQSMIIYMYQHGKSHSLTPISITSQNADDIQINVYDSNWPNDFQRVLEVNFTDNSWKYEFEPGDTWDSHNYTLGILPLSMFTKKPIPPWFDLMNNTAEIRMAGAGHLLISNTQGQKIGFEDSRFVNTIPEAFENTLIGFSGEVSEPSYTIPLPGNYEIRLNGRPDEEIGLTSIAQFGAEYVVYVSKIPVQVSTHDSLVIASDGSQLTFLPDDTDLSKSIDIEVVLKKPTATYQFQFLNVDIGRKEIVSLQADTNEGQIIFSNAKESGGNYDIVLTRFDENGESQFTYKAIKINAQETHTLNFINDNMDSIVLKVDQNRDGQPEIETQLFNKGNGETVVESGSHNQAGISFIVWLGIVFAAFMITFLLRRVYRINRLHK